jgi:hypothetical protein
VAAHEEIRPTAPAPQRETSLLPREHGAWGQLAFPLATGLALGRPGPAALLLASAAVLAFLAHEPLLVVLGQRGRRARDAAGAVALRRLGLLGAGALAAGAAGLVLAPGARLAAILPAALALAVLVLARARLERTVGGELLVAAALAAWTAPVALAAGASPRAAWTSAAVWVAALSAATLAVQAIVLRSRTKGEVDRRPLAAMASLAMVGCAVWIASHGWLPWAAAVALLPVVLAALALTALPVRPRRLAAAGWALVGASAGTLLVLVLGLR